MRYVILSGRSSSIVDEAESFNAAKSKALRRCKETGVVQSVALVVEEVHPGEPVAKCLLDEDEPICAKPK